MSKTKKILRCFRRKKDANIFVSNDPKSYSIRKSKKGYCIRYK